MEFFKYVNCGLFVVSSESSGCVINTLTQVNSKDPLVTISINKDNYTNEVIKKCNKFIHNSLQYQPLIFIHFYYFQQMYLDIYE